MSGFLAWVVTYKWQLVFYAIVILLVWLLRKRLEMHGIMGLFHTKVGIKTIDRLAAKYGEWFRLFGLASIGIAFIGLGMIIYWFLDSLWKLFTVPNTPPPVSLVIPGFPILGLGITPPLIIGWLALFTIVTIHECSHGVIARVHNLKILSTGLLFIGIPLGAFVRPDEKKMAKQDDVVQYSILAAGPVSNLVTGFFLLLVASLLIVPAMGTFVNQEGYRIAEVIDGTPAKEAGLVSTMVITRIDNVSIKNSENLTSVLRGYRAGDRIHMMANGTSFAVTLAAHPDVKNSAYLGIKGGDNLVLKDRSFLMVAAYAVLSILFEFFKWVYILSFGIALVNLYPIFITDGAQMLRIFFMRLMKSKDQAIKWWAGINKFCLALLIFLFFFGIVKQLF